MDSRSHVELHNTSGEEYNAANALLINLGSISSQPHPQSHSNSKKTPYILLNNQPRPGPQHDSNSDEDADQRSKSIAWADAKVDTTFSAPSPSHPTYVYNKHSHSKPSKSIFSNRDRSGLTVSLEVDLALKKDALSNITEREAIIQRLLQLRFHDPMITKSHVKRLVQEVSGCEILKSNYLFFLFLASLKLNLTSQLRNISLFCVESIVAWRKAMEREGGEDNENLDQQQLNKQQQQQQQQPHTPFISPHKPNLPPLGDEPASSSNSNQPTTQSQTQSNNQSLHQPHHLFFRWRDENYLIKMIDDLSFLKDIPQVLTSLPNNVRLSRNPFLLPHTLDDLNLLSSSINSMGDVELSRSKQAARIILKEEKRDLMEKDAMERKHDRLQQQMQQQQQQQQHLQKQQQQQQQTIHFHSISRANSFNIATSLPPAPSLNTRELKVFAKLANPPMVIAMIFACVKILVRTDSDNEDDIPTLNRKVLRQMLRRPMAVVRALESFNPNTPIPNKILQALYPIVTNPKFAPEVSAKSHSLPGCILYLINKILNSLLARRRISGRSANRSVGWRRG